MDRYNFSDVVNDDHIRQHVNRRLTEEISKYADDSLRCGEESSVPFGDCSDMIPDVNDIPSGNVWRTLNSFRILHQYCSNLSSMCQENPFLMGDLATCPKKLEWVKPLCRPMHIVPLPSPRRDGLLDVARKFHDSPSLSEQLYYTRVTLPCQDIGLTRLLLEHEFPDSQEYEVHICTAIIQQMGRAADFNTWKDTFRHWRDSGMYYPMCVASQYMGVRQWVSEGVDLDIPVVRALGDMLEAIRNNRVNRDVLECFCNVYNRDHSKVTLQMADTMDRLAVFMRVKSNRSRDRGFNLDECLRAFPKSFGVDQTSSNYNAWFSIKSLVEDTFLPCVLMCKSRRATWGYNRLSLQVTERNCLSFQERKLEWVDRVYQAVADPDLRITDILWRVGDIATSKEIAACLLHPRDVTETILRAKKDKAALQSVLFSVDGRQGNLLEMSFNQSSNDPTHYHYFVKCMEALEGCAPAVREHVYSIPHTLAVWRVDIPPRGIIYTGGNVQEMMQMCPSRHHLPKVIVNSRMIGSVVGDVHFIGHKKSPVEINLIRAMANYCKDSDLHTHPFNYMGIKSHDGVPQKITLTTLPEAISCFVLHPPIYRNVTHIRCVSTWENNSIDHRYSEVQHAKNGIRLRDWTAMHVDSGGTHQARLAAHALEYTRLYTTLLPWFRDGVGLKWVKMTATQRPHNIIIQGKTLRQSVETRYFHDTRMLPLADRDNMDVSRKNCEIYSATDGKVIIAYAATPIEGDPDKNGVIDMAIFEDCTPTIKTEESNPEVNV